MEFGLYTFGDILPDPATGKAPAPRERMREIVKLAKLADEVGLDVFAVGEHHRLDMVVSSPPVVLAAIAEATQRIKLSPATTLLNTLDPVRVFEDFATLDLLSEGRAELLVGRGSFVESFELFGYDMKDYDALFAEKLGLLMEINRNERVTWQGRFRPPLRDAEVSPRPERPLPLWIGVGGTPQSAVRAGSLGIPMNIAILGGPDRFAGFVDIYRRAGAQAGHDASKLRVAVSSHGLFGDDAKEAREDFYLRWGTVMRKGLRNRFPPRPFPREYFDMEAGPRGAFHVGTAEEAVERILWQREALGMDRILLQF
ncbi:MAG TPA: LLM class flavin-dependent oxidoreductase, partial [Candidatus Thermoplasmatota archaeon]|nr:LLM class flavin-dependent oxidoreductase [Candidatus Thermoplasmatota archaeon]